MSVLLSLPVYVLSFLQSKSNSDFQLGLRMFCNVGSGEMGWGQGTVLRSEVNSTHIMRRLTIGNRKQKGGIIET